jgi:mRNA-degrading endonuclease YafQ of YafQ-DinJ toxin-antitoxin module
MRIEQTREFEKDTKKITGKQKQRLDEIIRMLEKGTPTKD